MDIKTLQFRKTPVLLLGVTTLLCLSTPALVRATAAQDDRPAQDNDGSRRDLAQFNQFLTSHPEVADQLRRDPSLADNRQFLSDHPQLQTFLQNDPGVRQRLQQDPNAFMREEDRFEHGATDRGLAEFNQFLDSHREVGDQVRKDPSLLDNREFVQNHPELDTFLRDHPEVRDEIRQNPNAFMQQEDRFGRERAEFNQFLDNHREIAEQVRRDPSLLDNRDFVQNHPELDTYLRDHPGIRDTVRQDPNAFTQPEYRVAGGSMDRDLAQFNQFLENHREIAEQLRKDPSLADNREFVQNHPPLETFLRDDPGVRDQLRQDPNAFMRREDQFEHAQNQNWGGRDAMHQHMADFQGFLGGHQDIAHDVWRDPSVVQNHEWVQNHPELDQYLNAHPDVRTDLMANPQSFVKGAQEQGVSGSDTGSGSVTTGNSTTGTTGSATGTTGTDQNSEHEPKPKQ